MENKGKENYGRRFEWYPLHWWEASSPVLESSKTPKAVFNLISRGTIEIYIQDKKCRSGTNFTHVKNFLHNIVREVLLDGAEMIAGPLQLLKV